MTAPRWLVSAKAHVGMKEIPGPSHNPLIVRWLRSLKAWWHDDYLACTGSETARSTGHPSLTLL